MTEKNLSDMEKLRVLLSHWLHHNEGHGKEYSQWAAVARQAGHAATAEYIEKAVKLLAEADAAFEKALESVGGPDTTHHHHHHHD